MVHSDFLDVLSAQTPGELLDRQVEFAKKLGFATASAMVVVDHAHRESEFFFVNSMSEEALVLDDPEFRRKDPVMQHCKHSSAPIMWGRETYASAGFASQWEEQARYGFHSGIALAFHLPAGRHFFVSVDRDQGLPVCRQEVLRMAADLYLFAAYAQEAALRVLLPKAHEAEAPSLSQRELEGLRWTVEGKTAWEIGRILSISEHTASRHLNNATRKLDCANKLHAAVKALRMGLIS